MNIVNQVPTIGELIINTNEISVPVLIPALSRPTPKKLKENFPYIESVVSDNSPINKITLNLGTILRPNENWMGAEEYKRRITPMLNLISGYQQALWLVENQDKPELNEFKGLVGKFYIDFPSLEVVHTCGRRGFLFLGQDGKRWGLCWNWLDVGFFRLGRIAFSGK